MTVVKPSFSTQTISAIPASASTSGIEEA